MEEVIRKMKEVTKNGSIALGEGTRTGRGGAGGNEDLTKKHPNKNGKIIPEDEVKRNHEDKAANPKNSTLKDQDPRDRDDRKEKSERRTSRSRSRSKDKGEKKKRKKKSEMTKEEREIEKQRKRLQKKRRRQNKRPYRDLLADKQVINNMKNNIDADNKIPKHLKDKYKKIELNPLGVILTNIPVSVTQHELRHFFNTFMKGLNPDLDEYKDEDPLTKVVIGDEHKYAVIEVVDHDTADKLLIVGTVEYKSYKIKIQRPKGFFSGLHKYMAQDDYFDQQLMNEQHKLYMGNLPTYLNEEDIKKLVNQIGPLKYFNLVRNFVNGIPVSRGYCFLEFQDPRVTEKAVKKLNGLEIGANKIRVQRVTNDAPDEFGIEDEMGGAGANKKQKSRQQPSNAGGSFLTNHPLIENPYVKAMLSIPQGCIIPSRVVQFLNMFSPEDLFDGDFYQELFEDIKQECNKFGTVEKIEIPMPDSNGLCCSAVGKVFVKFYYIRSAKRARYKLNGRPYNERTVIASFFPEDEFDRKEYAKMDTNGVKGSSPKKKA